VILLAVLTSLAPAGRASAQLGEEIPNGNYYVAVQGLYLGEYRDAAQELRRQSQRGLRTTLARWVDSICYHAMLGEVFYHQGRNAEALAEFDQACQYLLKYPNWLTRVSFQRPPQPDPNPARRVAPWGQSTRQSVPAQFSRTEQVAFGQLDNSDVVRRGGVVMPAEYRRVNIVEIVRTTCLAIRRRAELLGPLAPHDQLFKDLLNVLSRGNLVPAGHWTSAWIDLERGLVQAALGQNDQASISLNRATVAGGQFDHPLTCVALLESGRLAIRAGQGAGAAQLLNEAGYSAYYYENWDVLTESVWFGWTNHLAHGGGGVYSPLDPIAAWAQSNRLHHISVKLRLAQAESLMWAGQIQPATALLSGPGRPLGQIAGSLSAIHHLYLQAASHFLQRRADTGREVLSQALAAQAAASLRNFQIGLTDKAYDQSIISPRIAVDLYKALLAEPTPADWAYQPLDVMAVLTTDHRPAFDRWFMATMERKDSPALLEVSELAKRRRFLASLPMGGRLVALRAILEAPEHELSRDAILQRQQILGSLPEYRELSAAGNQLTVELQAGPVLAKEGENFKQWADRYEQLKVNAKKREDLLMQLALRRLPASLEFPPRRSASELQEALPEGEALMVFHSAGGQLYAFLVTRNDVHLWGLGEARRLRPKVADFLRDLGNYSSGRTVDAEELMSSAWHKSAGELYKAIFADARLDLAKTESLVIIPDDVLWYLPFEALLPDPAAPSHVLAANVPIRYGPTAALAVGNDQPLRRPQRTGIVGAELAADETISGGDDLWAGLEGVVSGPLRIGTPLSAPGYLIAPLLDTLIVLDDVSSDRASAGWSPLPKSSVGASDTLDAWMELPYGGPERVVVSSFTTEAEQGLRTMRRGAGDSPGGDVFQTACRLMATGARTILLSRWRTGGRTNYDLVREFVQELPEARAADAWRRAVMLAREAPADVNREPRLKRSGNVTTLPTAEHPFFWAGYLLVDTGTRPAREIKALQLPTPAGGEVINDAAGATIRVPLPPLPAPQSAGGKQEPTKQSGDGAKVGK
jgi:hypothetical protein